MMDDQQPPVEGDAARDTAAPDASTQARLAQALQLLRAADVRGSEPAIVLLLEPE